jgi:hypothetical protein
LTKVEALMEIKKGWSLTNISMLSVERRGEEGWDGSGGE